jgi:DNA-binding IclR family transcriptional regulator
MESETERSSSKNSRSSYERYIIRSVQRSINVLFLFLRNGNELSATEISRELDLSRSTTFRILVTLAEKGLIEKNPINGNYRLGVSCLALGSSFLNHNDLRQRALKQLEQLRDITEETVHLGILDGNQVVYIEKLSGLHPIGLMSSYVGGHSPAYCTGLGKALLAFSPQERCQEILAHVTLHAFTENTITDIVQLQAELAQIRMDGYAFDNQEHERGVACVAAPVFDYKGLGAAISIAGPAERITKASARANLVDLVRRTAQEISAQLGGGINSHMR